MAARVSTPSGGGGHRLQDGALTLIHKSSPGDKEPVSELGLSWLHSTGCLRKKYYSIKEFKFHLHITVRWILPGSVYLCQAEVELKSSYTTQ